MVSGWKPIDIGPRSLEEMTNSLSECKVLKYYESIFLSTAFFTFQSTVAIALQLSTVVAQILERKQ